MKSKPELARVIGTSHERLVRVEVHDASDAPIGRLDVHGGTVTGSAVDVDRWTASLDVSGPEWVPDAPGHPLSGLSRAWLRIWMGATVDTRPVLIPVCRVIPTGTRVVQSAQSVEISVDAVGPAGWLATAAGTWTPTAGETCQAMIRRIVTATDPPSWMGQVSDSTAAVPVPADYAGSDTAWSTVEDLCAFADIAAYFDAESRLTLRPPLPVTAAARDAAPAVADIAAGTDLVAFDAEMGRDYGFANWAELTFEPLDPALTPVVGRAFNGSGPLSTSAVGFVKYAETRRGRPTQAVANARAQTLMRAGLLAWRTTSADVVPDPRLEPDDVVNLVLPDRTEKARVTVVDIPLDPAATMRVGMRTYQ